MPSIWVSDEDYETLIDIKADLEKHRKRPASFSDVVSHLMVKKRMLGGKSRKAVKNTRRAIRAKALTAAISAFMLISLISVFQAGTASALDGAVRDRTTAITAAADRLVEEQNPDGGFRMWISETPPGTYLRTHNIGVTAIGILKAHELLDNAEYETALAKTYKFVVDHEPGWIEDPNDNTKWKESPSGVNSWPDIHFLIGLAEAAALDSSLLAAIQSEVPETTVSDIVELAKDRWDDRLVHYDAVPPNVDGTATTMAERLIEVRIGQGYETLIPWDLEAAVKSAIALHEKYPEDGYLEQAQDITEAIYDCTYGDPSYLDINDNTEKCYTLGLAGAIEAFTEAGLYSEEASGLKDRLIAYQNEVGFWDANDISEGEDQEQESVQATAYAIMALIAQGDDNARTAAVKGSNWLVNTQDELGGWDPSSLESEDECLEVDGEAAWALATAEAPVTIGEDGYYSIQSAINSASEGDTIEVAAGTYNEQVVINKQLTLNGANADVNAVTEARGSESIIDGGTSTAVTTSAGDVIVNGFTLDGGITLDDLANSISGGTISNNIITGADSSEEPTKAQNGIRLGWDNGRGVDHVTIENNTITDSDAKGIRFANPKLAGPGGMASYITISGNKIENNGSAGIETYGPGHNTIINNTISGNIGNGINLKFDDGDVVTGNTITNNTRAGIVLREVTDTVVENNGISGHLNEENGLGIWVREGSIGNIISYNDITGNYNGILIKRKKTDVDQPSGNSINFNNISGNNYYGILNALSNPPTPVDATLNWWGDPSGPQNPITNLSATGDNASDNVDYTPWLNAPYSTGVARSWNVQNVNTGENFNSIQEAIDNASESNTIIVHPGTYVEAVKVDKSITLQGEPGAIIRPDDTTPTHAGNRRCGIYVASVNNVIIDGFEIDGTGGDVRYGIYPFNSNNTVVRNNIVHNIGCHGDDSAGVGIIYFGWGQCIDNATIENNTVYNTGRMGIGVTAWGPSWRVCSDIVITNNTVHDAWQGPTSDHGGGIQINVAKDCSIANNLVYDVRNGQRGIYMFGSATGNTITYNTLRDNPIGIQLWISGEGGDLIDWEGGTPTSPEVCYNNIYNNGSGARSTNIAGTPMVMDATLNWWGDPSGPSGVGLGTGDKVSVNVNYDPWLPRPLPTISDISVSGVTTTSATITWTTALPADSRVEYGPTIAYGLTSSIPDLTTSHSLGLTELTPSTTYHFRVRSEDAYGHVDNSGDLTFITAAPPPPATLTVGTTPIKANVYVDGSLWGVAPRTRSLAAGTYTISFGDVLGYLTPAPDIVTLAAGETRTVTGVYKEIPPENIENQSPTYDLPSITPDENATILVENTALTEITIQVKNAAENVKITVQEVTEGAAGIAIGAPGTTYKYLNIVAENITDAQIGAVVIRFKVEKSWIIANEIDIATITLNHYDPLTGEWTSLPTTYLSEDDTYVYFSAISPGLSIFGVSGSAIIPANFELSNLVITPSEVSVGETVTISVVVNNAGGQTGSTTVTLEINGAAVDTLSTTLDAGESTTVTFTVSEDVADTYTVNVAGLTGSFVVKAPPAPPIVPLAVSIIIIVLAIGIVLWFRRIG